eukprot:14560564-Heterocapsa_arctica.AAC.1
MVVKRTQALALAVRDKVTIIKTGGQSKATYGAAVDPFTQGQLNTSRVTGLLVVDNGELEPGIAAIVKEILVKWLRQMEGGIPQGIADLWKEYAVYAGPARGLVNCLRRNSINLDGKI